jgi:hypothetical protein
LVTLSDAVNANTQAIAALQLSGCQVLTSFPSNPASRQCVYRSDLQAEFHWDQVRSRWLGELESRSFNENSDDDRIKSGDVEFANLTNDGFMLPYDAVITRVWANTRDNETMTLSWFLNGVSSFGISWTGGRLANSGEINIAWNTGVVLSGRVLVTQSNFVNMLGIVQYRRVAT